MPDKLYPEVIPSSSHAMRCQDLSPNTLKVLKTLISHNYKAYAVGGCVRDKLMGQDPKDFDVVTNATPEQIKACFRNCRLIGRRFRLAHITFGREIIEVATFRGHHKEEEDQSETKPEITDDPIDSTRRKLSPREQKYSAKIKADKKSKTSQDGQLLRDNIFGSIEEDAARRDFTFNAMYFDVSDESILDFANGMTAIKERQIEMIGPSDIRFREDPVRMIRAIRFAAKLNMKLPDSLSKSIKENAHLLANIPAARLFEETNKLLLSGYGVVTFESLVKHKLLAQLFPLLADLLSDENSKEYQLVLRMLKNTDNRINNDQRITPAFLYATFLWYPMEEKTQALMFESSMPMHDALNLASADIMFRQSRRIMIPKRFSIPVREMWTLQLRLQKRQGKRCLQLITHPRFRAAYDFLLLRGQTEGGELLEIAQWWTDFQKIPDNEKQKWVAALPNKSPRRRRKRKPKT
ncbi:polynucleotide adenylyltransferase PcnB [Glaciecola petra]|uniref:Poly(A) polymerase I n=1 Tax=Glaciecola petra TaxID=3075602 RepID=A0ABU2ZTV1_9ALTE|nr:polynucleotide adenylyltransferase PcnB [Aestuariibacter sp. P117]MDT0595463.1 polynucleotide adenylyltransferase PcnB [Aestuariibacter sp. P117]